MASAADRRGKSGHVDLLAFRTQAAAHAVGLLAQHACDAHARDGTHDVDKRLRIGFHSAVAVEVGGGNAATESDPQADRRVRTTLPSISALSAMRSCGSDRPRCDMSAGSAPASTISHASAQSGGRGVLILKAARCRSSTPYSSTRRRFRGNLGRQAARRAPRPACAAGGIRDRRS